MTSIKALIYIAIPPTGKWAAYGATGLSEQDAMSVVLECTDGGERRYFVEGDLPVPDIAALPISGTLTAVSE